MFSARRKPKRIARDEPERSSNDEEGMLTTSPSGIRSDNLPHSWLSADSTPEQDNGPVVRRPNAAPKSKSKLRTSFAPDEAEDSSDAPVVVAKTKPRISQSLSSQSLPRFNLEGRVPEDTTSRPSYSKSALEELRNSTPSTPKDLSIYDPSSSGAEEGIRDLDIASKFGPNYNNQSSIPSASEIAEKKSRRARLAKESQANQGSEDFISLDDDQLYDDDGEFRPQRMQVGTYLRPDPMEKDTRLVRDDEDILEGFESYTEDAESKRITMGRKQLLQAQKRDRDAMREMINTAEGNSSDSSDSDSEVERNRAYETAQTAHGMDGLSAVKEARRKAGANRPRQPKEVTSVPKLATALENLRERIARVEIERVKVERRRQEIRKERAEIVAGQEHIQRSLIEAGEELERITKKQAEETGSTAVNGSNGGGGLTGRGLDSMGLAPAPT